MPNFLSNTSVGYLGPEGTFSHLVAKKRFGRTARLIPCEGIYEIFEFVQKGGNHLGIAPIENSTGGTIFETIDCLVEFAGRLHIREELSLNVKLALLGREGPIRRIYSHYVPLHHCRNWIKKHFPDAELHETDSTAIAAQRAAAEADAAAIGTREAGRRLGLEVLAFPVESEVPNITDFVLIGVQDAPEPRARKTSLLVMLENRPGSLFDFLAAFKRGNVNLTRLISRPIIGQPKSYWFVVDIEGTPAKKRVAASLEEARAAACRMDILGVYPVRRMYAS